MAQYLRVVLSDDEPFKSLYNGIEQKLEGSILEGALKRLTDVPEGQFYTDQFFKWRDSCDGPWAACINYMDAHWPFLSCLEYDNWEGVDRQTIRDIRDPTWQYYGGSRPLSERQAMVGNYDGCIRQTDAELERLIKGLRQRGELSDTLVVITADHGEGFGEKSPLRDSPSIGHGATGGLEEWILHVPLLLKLPGQTRGHRVSNPATLREFRDVVLDSLNGSVATDAFVPDGQVRASTLGQNPKTRQKAQRYVTDLPRCMPSGRVVYQPSPNGVRKSAVVGDQTGVFDCSRNSETAVENADATADISEAFNTLSRADVVKEMTDGVSEDVERRLKELGYR